MDPDDQKKQTQTTSFLSGCVLDGSYVLPAPGIRLFIQDAARLYWQLLGDRWYILLTIRILLVLLFSYLQISKT